MRMPCEVCEGRRFQSSVLDFKLGGRDISEVLGASVTEAEQFFATGDAKITAAHTILARLVDVGLGYIRLGQPLPTLSGGERQRLKLATHMGERGRSLCWMSGPLAYTSRMSIICSASSTVSSIRRGR